MNNIRPARPLWRESNGAFTADTALGELTVFSQGDNLWAAHLNGAAFPILYEDPEQAKLAAKIVASRRGLPHGMELDWQPNDRGGLTADSIVGTFHMLPSHAIKGFFILDGNVPADVPLADVEQAKDACYQYLTFVWFSLSEFV